MFRRKKRAVCENAKCGMREGWTSVSFIPCTHVVCLKVCHKEDRFCTKCWSDIDESMWRVFFSPCINKWKRLNLFFLFFLFTCSQELLMAGLDLLLAFSIACIVTRSLNYEQSSCCTCVTERNSLMNNWCHTRMSHTTSQMRLLCKPIRYSYFRYD